MIATFVLAKVLKKFKTMSATFKLNNFDLFYDHVDN